jgi:hypothetical protein
MSALAVGAAAGALCRLPLGVSENSSGIFWREFDGSGVNAAATTITASEYKSESSL